MEPDEIRAEVTDALDALAELLVTAKETFVSIVIEPDPDGWKIHHAQEKGTWPAIEEYEFGAGPLSAAYTLKAAAEGAVRPFNDITERIVRHDSR